MPRKLCWHGVVQIRRKMFVLPGSCSSHYHNEYDESWRFTPSQEGMSFLQDHVSSSRAVPHHSGMFWGFHGLLSISELTDLIQDGTRLEPTLRQLSCHFCLLRTTSSTLLCQHYLTHEETMPLILTNQVHQEWVWTKLHELILIL